MKHCIAAIEESRWNDNVGIDSPEWDAQPPGQGSPPALRFTAGVFIANKQRGPDLMKKGVETIARRAAHHKPNAKPGRIFGHILQTLGHEVVVTQIGAGVIWNHREEDDHWQAQQIRSLDGQIKGGVINDPHRPLHPVDDASATFRRRATAAHLHARMQGQPF